MSTWARPQLVLILGKRGTGKSTWARALRRRIEATGHPTVVRDPLGEYGPGTGPVLRGTSSEEAARTARELARRTRRVVWLFLEEIDSDVGRQRLDETSQLRHVIHYGRHMDVGLIAVARRPANVHPDLRNLADVVYIGRLTGDRDLAWVEEWQGKRLAEQVREAPVGRFLRVEP